MIVEVSTEPELQRLRTLYHDALHRRTAAERLAERLSSAREGARSPGETARLGAQIGTAQEQARDAAEEAGTYARRAQSLIDSFARS